MVPMDVVIVNYNTRQHLRACLVSVQAESPNRVTVVDNNSSDGSVEMLRADFPGVTLYANTTNPGYGTAANQGIANSTARYVLLLNSDTLLQPGALQALSNYLDSHPRAAIVGPCVVNPDMTLQASCRYFPGTLKWMLSNKVLSRLIWHLPIIREQSLRTWSHSYPRSVDWVEGAALAIRCEAFKAVNGFDESFFMYSEETDLCRRLINAGWQIHFAPVATIVHVGKVSSRQHRAEMLVQLNANHIEFHRRYYSGIHLAGLIGIAKSRMVIRLIHDTARFHLTRDECERARLAENIFAWRRVLTSRTKVRDVMAEHSTATLNPDTAVTENAETSGCVQPSVSKDG